MISDSITLILSANRDSRKIYVKIKYAKSNLERLSLAKFCYISEIYYNERRKKNTRDTARQSWKKKRIKYSFSQKKISLFLKRKLSCNYFHFPINFYIFFLDILISQSSNVSFTLTNIDVSSSMIFRLRSVSFIKLLFALQSIL